MQVIAFSTPSRPDWRWRIVNYAGEVVEESLRSFSSIATAVAGGQGRLRELGNHDVSVRANPFRRTTVHRRGQ
jgi:hypothetical protein